MVASARNGTVRDTNKLGRNARTSVAVIGNRLPRPPRRKVGRHGIPMLHLAEVTSIGTVRTLAATAAEATIAAAITSGTALRCRFAPLLHRNEARWIPIHPSRH